MLKIQKLNFEMRKKLFNFWHRFDAEVLPKYSATPSFVESCFPKFTPNIPSTLTLHSSKNPKKIPVKSPKNPPKSVIHNGTRGCPLVPVKNTSATEWDRECNRCAHALEELPKKIKIPLKNPEFWKSKKYLFFILVSTFPRNLIFQNPSLWGPVRVGRDRVVFSPRKMLKNWGIFFWKIAFLSEKSSKISVISAFGVRKSRLPARGPWRAP